MNLYQTLRAGFAGHPDRDFLCPAGEPPVSFAQIDARSAQFAACLHDAGVGPGERLLVQLAKSVDAVALYLAALRTGAVYVPLNTAYTPAELDYFLEDADPALLVGEARNELALQALAASKGVRVLTLSTDGGGSLGRLADTLSPGTTIAERADDAPCAMLYTSGTTGRSKGAVLSADNLRSNALALCEHWQFSSSDVLLHALPIFHVHGLFVALHCALLSGCRVVFLPRFDVDSVVHALPDVTVMMGVPTFYQRLLEAPAFSPGHCENVRLFISGSAPLAPALFEAFEARTGHRLLERYGMTETGMLASNPVDGERVPGSVGFPLPGVQLRVVDAVGQTVDAGTTGTVEVRGDGVFAEYWRQPEKTAASFRAGGWFITGDHGVLDPDGRLHLQGRDSDLVISGGYNIYPAEVENAIAALPGVEEVAVIGAPHADLGEAVVALVTGTPRFASVRDLDELLAGSLARFKRPRLLVTVDALPRNAMGKVQKAVLRERYAGAFRD
ncbi:MAG: AMP-binding protein [Pseudomonadota bacterium]